MKLSLKALLLLVTTNLTIAVNAFDTDSIIDDSVNPAVVRNADSVIEAAIRYISTSIMKSVATAAPEVVTPEVVTPEVVTPEVDISKAANSNRVINKAYSVSLKFMHARSDFLINTANGIKNGCSNLKNNGWKNSNLPNLSVCKNWITNNKTDLMIWSGIAIGTYFLIKKIKKNRQASN